MVIYTCTKRLIKLITLKKIIYQINYAFFSIHTFYKKNDNTINYNIVISLLLPSTDFYFMKYRIVIPFFRKRAANFVLCSRVRQLAKNAFRCFASSDKKTEYLRVTKQRAGTSANHRGSQGGEKTPGYQATKTFLLFFGGKRALLT